jgi:hypothetical protein
MDRKRGKSSILTLLVPAMRSESSLFQAVVVNPSLSPSLQPELQILAHVGLGLEPILHNWSNSNPILTKKTCHTLFVPILMYKSNKNKYRFTYIFIFQHLRLNSLLVNGIH